MGHGYIPISTQALEHALYLPEGYSIISVHYDVARRELKCVVASDELEPVQEYSPLPELCLIIQQESDPTGQYAKFTGRVEAV